MKIIGQLVCGPNEMYLNETLDEFKRLCDYVVVATCNATDREKKMIAAYGFEQYEDNREWGKHQPDIKTLLLSHIMKHDPSWILVLDADETVPTVSRETLETLTENRIACQFYVVNLWNDTEHYMRTMAFFNVRFYKPMPELGLQFLKKPVHCGNAPPYAYAQPARESYVPHILLHKGLMDKHKRVAKAERYRVYDPHALHKGREYYDALEMGEEATGTVYDQEAIVNKIKDYCQHL